MSNDNSLQFLYTFRCRPITTNHCLKLCFQHLPLYIVDKMWMMWMCGGLNVDDVDVLWMCPGQNVDDMDVRWTKCG